MRKYGYGWFRESARHSLAARGVKTKLNGKLVGYTNGGIPVTVQNANPGRKYPIPPEEVAQRFKSFNPAATEGIKEINFRNPGIPATKQDKAWAQYVRGKQRINIFSQPEHEVNDKLRLHMAGYVIPHEVGHHATLHNLKLTEDPVIIEEARADAMVDRKDPTNPRVVEEYVEKRKAVYGEKGSI